MIFFKLLLNDAFALRGYYIDKDIYFNATDVGKVCGYKNPYAFSSYWTHLTVSIVLTEDEKQYVEHQHLNQRIFHIHIPPLISILKKSKYPPAMLLLQEFRKPRFMVSLANVIGYPIFKLCEAGFDMVEYLNRYDPTGIESSPAAVENSPNDSTNPEVRNENSYNDSTNPEVRNEYSPDDQNVSTTRFVNSSNNSTIPESWLGNSYSLPDAICLMYRNQIIKYPREN